MAFTCALLDEGAVLSLPLLPIEVRENVMYDGDDCAVRKKRVLAMQDCTHQDRELSSVRESCQRVQEVERATCRNRGTGNPRQWCLLILQLVIVGLRYLR